MAEDLAVLRATHVNAMLIGPSAVVDAAIATLQLDLRQPVVAWTPTDTPQPPSLISGTLIVRNLTALEEDQQQRFLTWMDTDDRRVQVIATSERHVWALVERGAFLTLLYYRLSVVCIDLTGVSADS